MAAETPAPLDVDTLRALAESTPREPWFPGDSPQTSYLAAVHPDRVLSLLDALRDAEARAMAEDLDAGWHAAACDHIATLEAKVKSAEASVLGLAARAEAAEALLANREMALEAAEVSELDARARLERAASLLSRMPHSTLCALGPIATDPARLTESRGPCMCVVSDLRAALLGEGGPT